MEFIIYCEKQKPSPWDKSKLYVGTLTAPSREEAVAAFTNGIEFKTWRFLACEPRSDYDAARKQSFCNDDEFNEMRLEYLSTAPKTYVKRVRKQSPPPALPPEVWNEKKIDIELAWQTTKVLCSGGHF